MLLEHLLFNIANIVAVNEADAVQRRPHSSNINWAKLWLGLRWVFFLFNFFYIHIQIYLIYLLCIIHVRLEKIITFVSRFFLICIFIFFWISKSIYNLCGIKLKCYWFCPALYLLWSLPNSQLLFMLFPHMRGCTFNQCICDINLIFKTNLTVILIKLIARASTDA